MNQATTANTSTTGSTSGAVLFAWLLVGIPLAWGVLETLKKSLALFH